MTNNFEYQEPQNDELDMIEEEQEVEKEFEDNQLNQQEEEEEEDATDGHADTLFDRHKLTLRNYLKYKKPEDANEIQNVIETEPPQIYEHLLKNYGPSLLTNTSKIEDLNKKKESRNDVSKPEKMTNDQLRESIQNLASTISCLNEEISCLKENIGTLEQQYQVYQQKKKEREMAALSAHAKKSSKSPKNKPAANPSPKKKTTK